MNIACWSPVRGDISGYFAGLFAAVAVTEFPCRAAAMENYIKNRNLGHCLLGERYDALRMDFGQYRSDCNFGDTFLEFLSNNTGKKIERRKGLEIMKDKLVFIPLNQSVPKEVYDYGICSMYEELSEFCRTYFDFTVWNLETNRNPATTKILDDADTVLALVPGKADAVEEFYMKCKAGMKRFRLVLYGFEKDTHELERLEKKACLRWGMDRKRITRIVFGNHFLECAKRGNLINYVLEQQDRKKEGSDYELLQHMRYLVFQVLRNEIPGAELDFRELTGFLYRRNHEELLEA